MRDGFVAPTPIKPIALPAALSSLAEEMFQWSFDEAGLPRGTLADLGASIPFTGHPIQATAAYAVFEMLTECNKTIDAMNLVLLDMAVLGFDIRAFEGSPFVRHRLLMRSFFAEHVRLRATLLKGIRQMQHHDMLDPAEAQGVKDALKVLFKGTVDVRNAMVHETPDPNDLQQLMLRVFTFKGSDGGGDERLQTTFKHSYDLYQPIFVQAASGVVELAQVFVNGLADRLH